LIISKDKRQPSLTGDSSHNEPNDSKRAPAYNSHKKNSVGQLDIYYDAVIACIRDADSILIFGPDESKDELKEYRERNNLSERII
jgi:hypothetical protein